VSKDGGETRRFYVWWESGRPQASWRVIPVEGATDCTHMDDAQFEAFMFDLITTPRDDRQDHG
jgi:hypothetical protein